MLGVRLSGIEEDILSGSGFVLSGIGTSWSIYAWFIWEMFEKRMPKFNMNIFHYAQQYSIFPNFTQLSTFVLLCSKTNCSSIGVCCYIGYPFFWTIYMMQILLAIFVFYTMFTDIVSFFFDIFNLLLSIY